jgi:hypothetical protein
VSDVLEESALREHLAQACEPGGALHRHGIAPEDAVIRRGRALRSRRRAGYAGAALGVTAVAAVAIAGLQSVPSARSPHSTATPPAHHTVTVEQLDPNQGESTYDGDPSWLVGAGEVDGTGWQLMLRAMTFNASSGDGSTTTELCTQLMAGSTAGDTDCGAVAIDDGLVGPQAPVLFTGGSQGAHLPYVELGALSSNVATVQVELSDGETLSLRPVSAHGRSYVAFAAPVGLGVSLVVVYDAHGTEIGQQTPVQSEQGIPIFGATWTAPSTG